MILYHCCICGGTYQASTADIREARDAYVKATGALPESDAVAFRFYGRDICPMHTEKVQPSQLLRAALLSKHGPLTVQLFTTKRGTPL